jgi:hypothetical protein
MYLAPRFASARFSSKEDVRCVLMDSDEEKTLSFKYDVIGEPLGSFDEEGSRDNIERPRDLLVGQAAAKRSAEEVKITKQIVPEQIIQEAPKADDSEIGEYLSLEAFDDEVQDFAYAPATEDDERNAASSSDEEAGATGYLPPPWARASVKRGLVRSPLLRLHQGNTTIHEP